MFPKSNSFFFGWIIQSIMLDMAYLLYVPIQRHFMKNDTKGAHCISACHCCSEKSLFC